MSTSRTTLSAAADDRKARLAKLKSLKRKQPDEDEGAAVPPETLLEAKQQRQQQDGPGSPPQEGVARMHLSGRNYDPETRGAKLGFDAPPTLGPDKQTLEEQAAELEAQARARAAEEQATADKGIDLFTLQPKQPNWDLKRELTRKLDVLGVRTDNAVARLVRERLAAKKAAAIERGEPAAALDGGADGGMLDGPSLEMGVRLREQEEEQEERREREADDDLA